MPQDPTIQYGALGVLVLVLGGMFAMFKIIMRLVSNHLVHDLEDRKEDRISRDANTAALTKLSTIIDERVPKSA
ncbi:hypothetical protein HY492_00085 [Candidatus Woesearchaeota archaeon]|nr:hypothetical protein [Candidatus Woesearchaeota archaeon]